MTSLSAQPGALVFSGCFAILTRHPIRGVASGRVTQSAAAQASFTSAVSTIQFDAPTVRSALSVGRKGYKQVR